MKGSRGWIDRSVWMTEGRMGGEEGGHTKQMTYLAVLSEEIFEVTLIRAPKANALLLSKVKHLRKEG